MDHDRPLRRYWEGLWAGVGQKGVGSPLLGFLGFRGFSLGDGVLMRCAARQAQEVGLPTVSVVASYERGCSAVMKIDVWPVKCSVDSPIKSSEDGTLQCRSHLALLTRSC
jgi:hypothetical protein